jgi:hypothetical protein
MSVRVLNSDMLDLPKSYISYSAADLWYKNPSMFRAKYYYPCSFGMSSPQTDYGKYIADLIKDDPDHPLVAHIPKYEIRDEGFTIDISGVPVLMYPDSLSIIGKPRIYEYKTGVDPWTQEKADEHMQTKLYSLGVKEKYGDVDDLLHLLWLPTVMESHPETIRINGREYVSSFDEPHMTGEIVTFPVVVSEMERFRARQWIIQAAHEIQADYKKFKKSVEV